MFQKHLYSMFSNLHLLAQLQEIQLIHTNLDVLTYLQVQKYEPSLLQTDDSRAITEHGPGTPKLSTYEYMTKTSTSCSCDFMFRRKMHKLFNLTHVPSIQDANWFSMWHVFFEKPSDNVCEGHQQRAKLCWVHNSQLGSFSIFSPTNTWTWHKCSAVTHHFQAP